LTDKLTIALRPSRILALALTLMAGTALGCAWISLPGLAFAPLAAGIILAWATQLAQALHRSERAARSLELDGQGPARWQDGSGQWQEAEILPGSYVSDWLIVLNMRKRALVILPDCASPDELRRLRVWLRWRLGRQ
jgi:hypothetical protein